MAQASSVNGERRADLYPANRPRLGVLSNVAFLHVTPFAPSPLRPRALRRAFRFGFSVGVRLAEAIPGDTTRPLAIESPARFHGWHGRNLQTCAHERVL